MLFPVCCDLRLTPTNNASMEQCRYSHIDTESLLLAMHACAAHMPDLLISLSLCIILLLE